MSQQEIPPEVLKLPVVDRIELVAKIWDSISAERLPPLSAAQRRTLEQRIAEHRANPESGMTLEELREELGRGR